METFSSRNSAYGYVPQYGDLYGAGPMRDQWGNPVMPPNSGGPMYNGQYPDQQQQQQQQQQQYGYTNPMYGGNYSPYSAPSSQLPPATSSPYYPAASPAVPPRTPFRLHDGPKASSPLATNSSVGNTPSSVATLSVAQRLAALGNRRTSESDNMTPTQSAPVSFSRQNSRDSVSSSREITPASLSTPHRVHTSVPAPEEDEMLPQNVSFIDSSAEDEPDRSYKLSDRLSQLNITSGSKTYRVHHSSDKESSSSPSPTRARWVRIKKILRLQPDQSMSRSHEQ